MMNTQSQESYTSHLENTPILIENPYDAMSTYQASVNQDVATQLKKSLNINDRKSESPTDQYEWLADAIDPCSATPEYKTWALDFTRLKNQFTTDTKQYLQDTQTHLADVASQKSLDMQIDYTINKLDVLKKSDEKSGSMNQQINALETHLAKLRQDKEVLAKKVSLITDDDLLTKKEAITILTETIITHQKQRSEIITTHYAKIRNDLVAKLDAWKATTLSTTSMGKTKLQGELESYQTIISDANTKIVTIQNKVVTLQRRNTKEQAQIDQLTTQKYDAFTNYVLTSGKLLSYQSIDKQYDVARGKLDALLYSSMLRELESNNDGLGFVDQYYNEAIPQMVATVKSEYKMQDAIFADKRETNSLLSSINPVYSSIASTYLKLSVVQSGSILAKLTIDNEANKTSWTNAKDTINAPVSSVKKATTVADKYYVYVRENLQYHQKDAIAKHIGSFVTYMDGIVSQQDINDLKIGNATLEKEKKRLVGELDKLNNDKTSNIDEIISIRDKIATIEEEISSNTLVLSGKEEIKKDMNSTIQDYRGDEQKYSNLIQPDSFSISYSNNDLPVYIEIPSYLSSSDIPFAQVLDMIQSGDNDN